MSRRDAPTTLPPAPATLALAAALALAAVAAASPPDLHAQQERPHILVVNDDGIGSEGIAAMVDELESFADVVVVAPAENRSGSSHSTGVRTEGAEVTPFRKDGELFGWAIDATPADATKFGIQTFGADRPFDLVVSGINAGANTGHIAHYSGTVGAAMEALFFGVPAVATSQSSEQDYALTARITGEVVRRVLREGLPEGVMLTINAPAGELRGVVARRMGGTYFGVGGFEEIGESGDTTSYRATVRGADRGGDDTDTAAYLDGYVTITPLRFDWTDRETLETVEGWDLEAR